jgi:DNA (cytosine-5)-methyltransferase 1
MTPIQLSIPAVGRRPIDLAIARSPQSLNREGRAGPYRHRRAGGMMRVVGTFSGIGGLELPFGAQGHTTAALCDWWGPSQEVLSSRYDGVDIYGDVAELAADGGFPSGVDLLTAGFPCTDLSQAGRTAGIGGNASGQVRHVFDILRKNPGVSHLVLENVRNMLVLDKGKAMAFLVAELEALGFRWAYRLVDSRFTGVPHRRHRVILMAARGPDSIDPRRVLFADNEVEPDHVEGEHLRQDAFGFYWTEGLRGLGWAVDAVPPLKGGSTVGIPSPPGVWVPDAPAGRRLLQPTVEHAEMLQGFERGWTKVADTGKANSPRWKLVGNAVTVGVTDWLVDSLTQNIAGERDFAVEVEGPTVDGRWPTAAWGGEGTGPTAVPVSTFPRREPYRHLLDVAPAEEMIPLSQRAAAGFLDRLRRGSLRRSAAFERDVQQHIAHLA